MVLVNVILLGVSVILFFVSMGGAIEHESWTGVICKIMIIVNAVWAIGVVFFVIRGTMGPLNFFWLFLNVALIFSGWGFNYASTH